MRCCAKERAVERAGAMRVQTNQPSAAPRQIGIGHRSLYPKSSTRGRWRGRGWHVGLILKPCGNLSRATAHAVPVNAAKPGCSRWVAKPRRYRLANFSPDGEWCSGQDSNLHALRHTHLKRVCLPIPPPEHFIQRKGELGESLQSCKAPKCACHALFVRGHSCLFANPTFARGTSSTSTDHTREPSLFSAHSWTTRSPPTTATLQV